MNDQQKKEILEAERFGEFCYTRNCSTCGIDAGSPIQCADKFYAIKIENLQKCFQEKLKEIQPIPYSPTRLEYFAAASIAGDANITPQGALSFARAVIEELDK